MFTAFLTITENNRDRIDVSAPMIEKRDAVDAVAHVIALREPRHTGVIVLDASLWEFSEIIRIDDNFLVE